MKVLVLGSNGQLGKTFVNTAPTNITIYPLMRKDFDINNFSQLQGIVEKIKPNYLINCIAYTNVNEAENEKKLSNLINSDFVEKLAEFSNLLNFNLIHFSTDYVFNGKKKKYSENDLKKPINHYGFSKSLGEENIIFNSKNFIIFRISSLFSHNGNNFVKTIIQKLKNNEDIKVVNDQFSKPTSAFDLTLFIWNEIISKKIQHINEIFHFTNTGKVISWYDFSKLIFSYYAKHLETTSKITPLSVKELNQVARRPEFSGLKTNKLQNYFNFKIPKLEQSLYKTIKICINKETS